MYIIIGKGPDTECHGLSCIDSACNRDGSVAINLYLEQDASLNNPIDNNDYGFLYCSVYQCRRQDHHVRVQDRHLVVRDPRPETKIETETQWSETPRGRLLCPRQIIKKKIWRTNYRVFLHRHQTCFCGCRRGCVRPRARYGYHEL